ncbi:MAG TPA: hypothetical protein VF183_11895 [Acidimicrobiales bacterium]
MAMTTDGVQTTTPPTSLSPRLQEFQAEVSQLKVTGGRANPERTGKIIGGLAMLAGIVIALIAYFYSYNGNPAEQRDAIVLAVLGLSIAVVGTGLYVVFSLTRYFRYWLVRLIYEHRDQTDRIVSSR